MWNFEQAKAIFSLPFSDLIYRAQTIHRQHFDPQDMQINTLLSIKTGSCPENCAYCPQSAHYNTGLKKEPLMQLDDVLAAAKIAKEDGATRFCMGAAWRSPHDKDMNAVCEMVKGVKALGLETCITLGLLKEHQAEALKEAGLDYYNHNIDTSESHYEKIITTRTFQDRLDTIEHVRNAGLSVCCGGILGMGETNDDRIQMILTLANMDTPPESIPINRLIKIPGTPMENQPDVDPFDFVRTIALIRILVPTARIRLSGNRPAMSEELQALCFLAGANSFFFGEKLLTTKNRTPEQDNLMLERLGYKKSSEVCSLKNTSEATLVS